MAMDLAVGILVIFALSVLSHAAGRFIRQRHVSLCFIGSLVTSLVFAWGLSGDLGWAAYVPIASVVFWSNLMPVLLSFAAGSACEAPTLARLSRPITVGALLILAAAYALTPYVRPLLAPVFLSDDVQWRNSVCLQSHPSTCAPAAAVTLLYLDGIAATERKMVESCLTSTYGTEPLGLYRGLAMAVAGSSTKACVADSDPEQWVVQNQLPNIALVHLDDGGDGGSSRWFLGPRSEGHAIVVLGRDYFGDWLIADPAFGKTSWSDEEFRARFSGDAIYLADRSER